LLNLAITSTSTLKEATTNTLAMDTNTELYHASAIRNTLVVVIVLALVVVIVLALVVGFGPRLLPAREDPNNVPAMSVAFIREKYDELTILVAMRKVLRVKWAQYVGGSPTTLTSFVIADTQNEAL
jgi:hypothetical protein